MPRFQDGQEWSCSVCGESCPGSWRRCWNCGASRDTAQDEVFTFDRDESEPNADDEPLWTPPSIRPRALVELLLVLVVAILIAQRKPAIVLFLSLVFVVVAPISGRFVPELRRLWRKIWPDRP